MKKLNKKQLKTIAHVTLALLLVVLGVVGTLRYMTFIDNVKADGVYEFKVLYCDEYHDKEGTEWLECDM